MNEEASFMNKYLLVILFVMMTLISGCEFWDYKTHSKCLVRNFSDQDILVTFSLSNSDMNDTLIVAPSDQITVFRLIEEGDIQELNDENFSRLGDFIKIFIDDSLIYTQNPIDKAEWRLGYSSSGDGITTYQYELWVTESQSVE